MPDGFKISEGYVEVTVKPNREQLRAAAQEAASEFESASTGKYDKAGQHAGREFATGARSTVGRDMEQALGDAGGRAGSSFVRDAAGRLRDERGRFVKEGETLGLDLGHGLTSGGRGITGIIKSFFSGARQLVSDFADDFSKVWDAAGKAGSKIGEIGGKVGTVFSALTSAPMRWIAGIAGGLEVIPPVLYAIAGGLAAIPALAVGASMALGALGLGTQGVGAAIGEVFNPSGGGGGGGGAQRADQLAAAERNLAVAQRDAREAQQALNDARVQARFDLADLNLQLERQQENEQEAALAIKEAQQALVQAEATGDPLKIQRAQLQLQEAVTGLKEAKQQTEELAYQKQQADAKGVEGSDKVVAALDRVQNSTNAVADAQAALRQTSISAAGGVVSAYSKLSPEAKKFVDEIARLKPQIVALQQYVQDRLFAGLDKKLDTWAHVWIPDLRKNMGMLAGDANTFAARLGDDLSKPEFVNAVDRISGVFDRLFTKFTTGGTLDKLVTGFGDLVDKASPFIESLAGSAIDKLGNAADSLDRAAKDGSLDRFFKEAAKDARDLWNIGKDVFEIVGKIIAIAFGEDTAQNNGKNGLDRLKDTLDDVKKWLDSDKGKQTVKDVIDGFLTAGKIIGDTVGAVAQFIAKLDELGHKAHQQRQEIKDDFTEIKNTVKGVFRDIIGAVVDAFKMIIDGAANAFGWVPKLGPQLKSAAKAFDAWADGVKESLDSIPDGKTINLRIVTSDHRSAARVRGDRWGGVHYAEDGLLSLGVDSAGIYPAGRPLYGFAEPDTGGELFMPRNGDAARNKALATVAAQWAGLDVTPARSPIATGMGMASPSSSTPTTLQPVAVHVGGEHLVDLVLGIVEDHPVVVSATAAEGDRQRRFTNSARS